MNRFMLIADNQKEALKAALTQLLQLPNPPILYYGTEIGLTQAPDNGAGLHINRVPMPWEEQDEELLAFTKDLLQMRQS